MYAYCENNPVIYSDSDGYLAGEAVTGLSSIAILTEILTAIAAAITSINWVPILIGVLVIAAIAATAYFGYTVYQNSKAQVKADALLPILDIVDIIYKNYCQEYDW